MAPNCRTSIAQLISQTMLRKKRLEVDSPNDTPLESFRATKMLFNKASGNAEKPRESPSELYRQLQDTNNTNTVHFKYNAFAGKKYGVGLQIMKKWGYVEGEGLGARRQGMLQPIETQVRKAGVGIGDDTLPDLGSESEEDEVELEEYYKGVPKKSLFVIVQELEGYGVIVPEWVKQVCQLDDSENDSVRVRLNELNNSIADNVADLKMAELTINQLEKESVKAEGDLKKLTALLSLLEMHDYTDLEDPGLIETVIQIQSFELEGVDIAKLSTLLLQAPITNAFQSWIPNDNNSSTLLPTLINLQTILPDNNDSISYFDSLVSSLWLQKIKSLEIAPDNSILVETLLDWSELIPSPVIKWFIHDTVMPILVTSIQDWDFRDNSNTDHIPPFVWIFDWLVIPDCEELTMVFVTKYKAVMSNWDPSSPLIPGLASFREVFGDSNYEKLMRDVILKNVLEFWGRYVFEFDIGRLDRDFRMLTISESLFEGQIRQGLRQYWFNQWLWSLYDYLNSGNADIVRLSDYLDKFFTDITPSDSNSFKFALDMINDLISGRPVGKYFHQQLPTKVHATFVQPTTKSKPTPVNKLTVTFKDVLADYCERHSLFLTPLSGIESSKIQGNNLGRRGHFYYRIGRDSLGNKGKVGYIEEDVLFLRLNDDEGQWWPISIDELEDFLDK